MARAVLARAVRLLAGELAASGFERDGYVFRRYNAAGDAVVVDIQPHASYSGTGFLLNLAFVLDPVWQWDRLHLGYPATKRPDTSHGSWYARVNRLDYDDWVRLAPPDQGDLELWVIADEEAIPAVVARVAARLRPRLRAVLPWLDRDHLRAVLATGGDELGYAAAAVRAWLLAEQGHVDELRELLFDGGSPDDADADPIDRAVYQRYALRRP